MIALFTSWTDTLLPALVRSSRHLLTFVQAFFDSIEDSKKSAKAYPFAE